MNSKVKIDPELLKILCCPKCKGDSTLEANEASDKLVCSDCNREYLLKEVPGKNAQGIQIPQLLINEED